MLKALQEEVCAPVHNYTTPLMLDRNQTDNSAEGHCIRTALQFRQELRTLVIASQESLKAEKLKKQRFNYIKQPDNINYISDTSVGKSGESL